MGSRWTWSRQFLEVTMCVKYVRSYHQIAEWTPAAKSADVLTMKQMFEIYGIEQLQEIEQEIYDFGSALRSRYHETETFE